MELLYHTAAFHMSLSDVLLVEWQVSTVTSICANSNIILIYLAILADETEMYGGAWDNINVFSFLDK